MPASSGSPKPAARPARSPGRFARRPSAHSACKSAAIVSSPSPTIWRSCAPARRPRSGRSRPERDRPMTRRVFASVLLAALTAGICACDPANAQTYPSRPVTVVVPGAAGGGGDFTARLVGEQLSKALGQQFVVENKPGANGKLAALTVARAAPDGYTPLLAYSTSHVANPTLFETIQC